MTTYMLKETGEDKMKRKQLSNSGSRKLFQATASKAHIKNNPKLRPMRGGVRL